MNLYWFFPKTKVVPEIQGKISRISTYNPSSSSYQPSVVISSHDPIPPSYHNYETYETYSPPSYSPSQSFNSYGPPSSSYGTPSNAYGQPGFSSYGASHHGHSNYGAPPPSQGEGKGSVLYECYVFLNLPNSWLLLILHFIQTSINVNRWGRLCVYVVEDNRRRVTQSHL